MTFYISPYRRLASIRQTMNRMLDEDLAETSPNDREMTLGLDVVGRDEDYLITALVPGLEADDLNIEIINNTLTIRGEFKDQAKDEKSYLLCELPEGRFGRTIQLPTAVDTAKVEASIKNGVLSLRVPKAEAHRPKTIKVSTN